MPKPTLDEKIKKISIECQDDWNFIREIRKLKQAFREDLPASNRKSCKESEHYFSRYKQGWNNYRKELCERWK